MRISEIFSQAEGGTLTYEQFKELAKEANANFTDLSDGKYVSKSKYEDDIKAKDTAIETLNGTISTRDADLVGLQKQLEDAGNDTQKLTELNSKLADLQSQYDADTQSYKAQLSRQAYEFAVKEFAGTKQFTSNAAKRDFISALTNKELKMEDGKILGADDFVAAYTNENADAFVIPKEEDEPEPIEPAKPVFVQPTPGPQASSGNESLFQFGFMGVRPKE